MPTEIIKIDFSGGWQPDWIPGEAPEGTLAECKNLYPEDDYYKPVKSVVNYSSTGVTGTALSGREFRDTNGAFHAFVFTTTAIYRLAGDGTLTDITNVGGSYGNAGDNWSAIAYGDWIIATNYNDNMQILKGMTESNFAALAGSPPKAKFLLFHSGYLLAANLVETAVGYPKKVRWSALENVEDWTASLTTGSDAQDLADATGNITGMVVVGDGFAIFHEESITTGRFIGAPYTFSFKANAITGIGAIKGTPISVNGVAYFWDNKDIYMFNGTQAIPIGGGVRKAVLYNLDANNLHRITVSYNRYKGIIMWSYPTTASDGTPDKILCYNITSKRFTHIDLLHQCFFIFNTNNIVTDIDSDALNALYSGYIDDFPDNYDFDNPRWSANVLTNSIVSAVSPYKIACFTGDAMVGEIITSSKRLADNILYINRLRPNIVNKTNISAGTWTKMFENETGIYTEVYIGASGYADFRASGRFASIKLTMGDHDGIMSCDVFGQTRGKR